MVISRSADGVTAFQPAASVAVLPAPAAQFHASTCRPAFVYFWISSLLYTASRQFFLRPAPRSTINSCALYCRVINVLFVGKYRLVFSLPLEFLVFSRVIVFAEGNRRYYSNTLINVIN